MTENSKDDVQEELDRLREEVEMLRAQRDAAEAEPEESKTSDAESDSEPTSGKKSGEYTAADLTMELQDLVEAIDKELKDTNPVTLLVVFALGAFVGRMLPR
jgi:hypothetical protein